MAQQYIETSRARRAGALPAFGMCAGTTVLTLDGALPVEFLTPGDRIVTRSGARRLKAVEMALAQDVRLVRVAANVLGTGRPEEAVRLMPGQPILLRDWRAEALYGKAQALVPVARLEDGEFVRGEVVDEARIFSLKLDAPAVIYAGGLEVACEAETVAA